MSSPTLTAIGYQGSLLADAAAPEFAPLPPARPVTAGGHRRALGAGAWVDVYPGWLRGADPLFDRLLTAPDWRAERRMMYDRVVDVPRLVRFYRAHEPLPDPLVVQARELLSARYGPEIGEPFATVGMCLYRDGRDSVAWHGDDLGRGRTEDTAVAILSLGAPRRLLLRPRAITADGRPGPVGSAARRSLPVPLGHGDLVVMGGSCQRTFEHCVPKTAAPVGTRISVQFRVRGVR